jgi:hypothetical protein
MIDRFDLVKLKTIGSVVWLSGPNGKATSPQGVWTVVAGVGGDRMLLLAKDLTLIQIPREDVFKVASYNANLAAQLIKRIRTVKDLSRYQTEVDNVQEEREERQDKPTSK